MEQGHIKPHPSVSTTAPTSDRERRALSDLMTVDEVAALLKVSKSWVYEHTRARDVPRGERLPCIKLGKYVRFDPESVRAYLARRVERPVGGRR